MPTGLPASEILHRARRKAPRANTKKPLPGIPRGARPEDPDPANRNKSLPRAAGSEHQKANKKGGSRSLTPDGNPEGNTKRTFRESPRGTRPEGPTKECGGVLLSHTLSSAVPSPRPGLSFRVRKGTGRLTWAMTTAKPIQRPTHHGIGRQTEPATIPIVAVREPDNGRKQQALHQYRRDHKKTMLPAIQREKPPQDETQPTRVGKCAAFAR